MAALTLTYKIPKPWHALTNEQKVVEASKIIKDACNSNNCAKCSLSDKSKNINCCMIINMIVISNFPQDWELPDE